MVGAWPVATWPMRLVALVGAMCMVVVVVLDTVVRGQPAELGVALAFLLPFYAVGLFVWWRAPRHLTARRLLVTAVLLGVMWVNESVAAVVIGPHIDVFPAWRSWAREATGVLDLTMMVMAIRLVALLPGGEYRRSYERVVLRALWLLPPLWPVLFVLGLIDVRVAPMQVAIWLFPLGPVLLGGRYFLLPAAQRRDLRWVLGMVLLITLAVTVPLTLRLLAGPARRWDMAAVVSLLGILVVPTGLLVAVFRHRMLDADVGIRRSTRYTMLWLVITLWYLGMTAGLGVTAGRALPLEAVVLVTVAVAVGFQPVRTRLNRLAERWVYGRRLSGYELLVRTGSAMEHAFDPGVSCQPCKSEVTQDRPVC